MTLTPADAARYLEWWGSGDNCLRAAPADIGAAEAILRDAPTLLRLDDAPHGLDVLAVCGTRLACRDRDGRVRLLAAHVGAYQSSIGRIELGARPSRVACTREFGHAAERYEEFALLSVADAQRLGIGVRIPPTEGAALVEAFGTVCRN